MVEGITPLVNVFSLAEKRGFLNSPGRTGDMKNIIFALFILYINLFIAYFVRANVTA